MKVLQMLPELNFGGVEIGTVDMAKQLIAMGHQPYVISAGGKLVETLHKMGVVHYTLPVHKKNWQSLLTIPKVAEIIRRENIDIVHVRSRVPAWIGYFASRNTEACFITSCHGYYSKKFFSSIMGWGKNVIVISSTIGRHMIDNFAVPPDRIRLVHRGLDIDRYTFSTTRFSDAKRKGKDKYIIANIARITPLKGHVQFLQAVRLAKRRFPNIEVWLIGSAGRKKRYLQEIADLIEKFGLRDSVKLLGARSDIPELLNSVNVLVLSTTVPEGFGRVLIEAGAAGVPVISTRVGGVLDVIEDRKDGYLVSPNDPLEMSEAIIRVIEKYPQHREMAESFRKKIEQEFTLRTMATRTLDVYRESLKKKRILVMKLGALGDVILAVPSLRALRKKYPEAHIALLVDESFAPLMDPCPYVNEVVTYKRNAVSRRFQRFWHMVYRLRRVAYDVSIDFQNNKLTHLLAYFGDVRRRYGYDRGMFGRLLSHGVSLSKDAVPPVQHQQRILQLLGLSEIDDTLELWATPEDERAIDQLLGSVWATPKKKMIGFVLSASKEWRSKQWPLEYFVQLARRLEHEMEIGIVLIGDAAGRAHAEKFLLQSDTDAANLVGQTTLRQMVALIDRMDCIVAGDTAPIHVAGAVGTNTVALFGPTDPSRHAPPGANCTVLKKNVSCGPCYKRSCTQLTCMRQLTVDEVYQAVSFRLAASTDVSRKDVVL